MSQSDENEEHGDEDDEGISVIISSEVDPINIPLPPSPVPVIISMMQEDDVPAAEPTAAEPSDSSLPADADSQATQPHEHEIQQDIQNPGELEQQDEHESADCADCSRPKIDKGKGRLVTESSSSSSDQQCTPQTPSSRLSRRAQRAQHAQRRSPKYQPILTIRSSHGWIWNQVSLLPVDLKTCIDHSQDLFVPHYMKDRCTQKLHHFPRPHSDAIPCRHFVSTRTSGSTRRRIRLCRYHSYPRRSQSGPPTMSAATSLQPHLRSTYPAFHLIHAHTFFSPIICFHEIVIIIHLPLGPFFLLIRTLHSPQSKSVSPLPEFDFYRYRLRPLFPSRAIVAPPLLACHPAFATLAFLLHLIDVASM